MVKEGVFQETEGSFRSPLLSIPECPLKTPYAIEYVAQSSQHAAKVKMHY